MWHPSLSLYSNGSNQLPGIAQSASETFSPQINCVKWNFRFCCQLYERWSCAEVDKKRVQLGFLSAPRCLWVVRFLRFLPPHVARTSDPRNTQRRKCTGLGGQIDTSSPTFCRCAELDSCFLWEMSERWVINDQGVEDCRLIYWAGEVEKSVHDYCRPVAFPATQQISILAQLAANRGFNAQKSDTGRKSFCNCCQQENNRPGLRDSGWLWHEQKMLVANLKQIKSKNSSQKWPNYPNFQTPCWPLFLQHPFHDTSWKHKHAGAFQWGKWPWSVETWTISAFWIFAPKGTKRVFKNKLMTHAMANSWLFGFVRTSFKLLVCLFGEKIDFQARAHVCVRSHPAWAAALGVVSRSVGVFVGGPPGYLSSL